MSEGAVEQSADSISEDLSAAFESYEVGDETPGSEANAEVESQETSSGANAEVSETLEAGEGETGVDTDAGAEGEVESLAAPEHWPQADKDLFTGLDPKGQQFLLDRHKAMEADYTRKTQEIADFRKTYDPVAQLFEPYQAELRANGTTPAEVVSRWASVDRALESDPAGTLQQLAQSYGLDLANLEAAPQVDPQVKALQEQMAMLTRSIQDREQAEVTTRHNTMLNEIESFSTQTNEAGEPAHPYFDAVVNDMAALAHAERSAGREPKLDALYERAVWANPEVREQMLAAQRKAAEEKAEKEAIAKAKQAKSASRSVSGSPTGSAPPTDDLSLRESLERQIG